MGESLAILQAVLIDMKQQGVEQLFDIFHPGWKDEMLKRIYNDEWGSHLPDLIHNSRECSESQVSSAPLPPPPPPPPVLPEWRQQQQQQQHQSIQILQNKWHQAGRTRRGAAGHKRN